MVVSNATICNNIVSGPQEEHIPAHLSYGQYLFDQLRKGGNDIALISADTDEAVTHNELVQKSVNLAHSLRHLGLKKGDVVALCSENRFEFAVAALATIYCGAPLCTLNMTYTPGEISHLLNISKPRFIFTSPLTAQNVQDCAAEAPFVEKLILFGDYDVIPAIMYNDLIKQQYSIDEFVLTDVNGAEDTLAIMCSSGTTGMPKGVELTHVNLLTLTAHMKYYFEFSKAEKKQELKTALSLIPWFHAYGFITTFSVVSMRIKTVFLIKFEEKQYLETIQNYEVNMTTIVPPLAVFLAKHPLVSHYRLSSLSEVWCGAAPLSREIQEEVAARTGMGYIKQGYGLTEVTSACTVDFMRKNGSAGTPGPGVRIKVTDIETNELLGPYKEGELWIKTPLRMKGYLGDERSSQELFDAAGYVRTGDVGYYDEDGSFYIVDRLKELIKVNGFQVAPAELESLLLRHEGVAGAGVVGAPHAAAGEAPAAFVVLQPGASLTADQLQDYVAQRVSPAKHLRGGVYFIDEIPKNASGKILRRELKKMLPKPNSKL